MPSAFGSYSVVADSTRRRCCELREVKRRKLREEKEVCVVGCEVRKKGKRQRAGHEPQLRVPA